MIQTLKVLNVKNMYDDSQHMSYQLYTSVFILKLGTKYIFGCVWGPLCRCILSVQMEFLNDYVILFTWNAPFLEISYQSTYMISIWCSHCWWKG